MLPPDGVAVIYPCAELDMDYLAVNSLVFDVYSRSACVLVTCRLGRVLTYFISPPPPQKKRVFLGTSPLCCIFKIMTTYTLYSRYFRVYCGIF